MQVKVVDNVAHVEMIREQLKANDNHCPCRLSKTEDTKCMCKEFREQIERGEAGTCHCGLYVIIPD